MIPSLYAKFLKKFDLTIDDLLEPEKWDSQKVERYSEFLAWMPGNFGKEDLETLRRFAEAYYAKQLTKAITAGGGGSVSVDEKGRIAVQKNLSETTEGRVATNEEELNLLFELKSTDKAYYSHLLTVNRELYLKKFAGTDIEGDLNVLSTK